MLRYIEKYTMRGNAYSFELLFFTACNFSLISITESLSRDCSQIESKTEKILIKMDQTLPSFDHPF